MSDATNVTNSSSLKYVLYSLLLVALIAAPLMGTYPMFVTKLLCFALFASAFNLLLGYARLLSFGHAAFFGGAGYVTGYMTRDLHVAPELGLLAGTAAGAFIGLIVGLLAIRRQSIYFAIITLALAQMLYFFCLQVPFTGGEDGLQGVSRGKLFGAANLSSDLMLYYVMLIIVVAAFLLIVRTIRSPFGQILKAIKENGPRATSLNYGTDRFKLLAFVLSAALTGLAGSLKTLVLDFETLTDVHWSMSDSVILITLVGGLGILSDPLLGVALVIALENKLGDTGSFLADATSIDGFNILGKSVTTVTGAAFVTCILTFRRGIMNEIAARMPWS